VKNRRPMVSARKHLLPRDEIIPRSKVGEISSSGGDKDEHRVGISSTRILYADARFLCLLHFWRGTRLVTGICRKRSFNTIWNEN